MHNFFSIFASLIDICFSLFKHNMHNMKIMCELVLYCTLCTLCTLCISCTCLFHVFQIVHCWSCLTYCAHWKCIKGPFSDDSSFIATISWVAIPGLTVDVHYLQQSLLSYVLQQTAPEKIATCSNVLLQHLLYSSSTETKAHSYSGIHLESNWVDIRFQLGRSERFAPTTMIAIWAAQTNRCQAPCPESTHECIYNVCKTLAKDASSRLRHGMIPVIFFFERDPRTPHSLEHQIRCGPPSTEFLQGFQIRPQQALESGPSDTRGRSRQSNRWTSGEITTAITQRESGRSQPPPSQNPLCLGLGVTLKPQEH